MAKTKIVLNTGNIKQNLLKGAEVTQFCYEEALKRRPVNVPGYEVETAFSGLNRINVSIVAKSEEARKDNWENNTLLKAVSR